MVDSSAEKIDELPNVSSYIENAEFAPKSNIIALTSNTIKSLPCSHRS